MNEYILAEFSIFYKRLIIIEDCLKNLIIQKYSHYYGDNAYSILYRYFLTIENNRIRDKVFVKIHNSNKTNNEKLISSVNHMYLREILNMFTNSVYLKNKRVKNNFFVNFVETNTTEFQKNQKFLNRFRNSIAHCITKKYENERKQFIKALVYFEHILNCNPVISISFMKQITLSKKLSVWDILSFIYNVDNTYFNDDKFLILLFDDIALINGYTFASLPQRWSILRQKYKLLEIVKENKEIESSIFDNQNQISFDFN